LLIKKGVEFLLVINGILTPKYSNRYASAASKETLYLATDVYKNGTFTE